MNEAVVADVQANMRKLEAPRVEKNQIAGLQLIFADRLTDARLFACAARQQQAGSLLKNVANEAAAVESLIRRTSAEAVVDANQRQRVAGDFGGRIFCFAAEIAQAFFGPKYWR